MSKARKNLSRDERLDWLQLIRTENIGPVTFHRLIARYGAADAALAALPDMTRTGRARRPIKIAPRAHAEQDLDAAERIGARAVAYCEKEYPSLLRTIADPPPIIFMIGADHLLDMTGIAIIGTRNASMPGRKIARQLAEELGAADYAIVSGLARGIDGAAHTAALDTGTIAVVAGGVDVIYPPEHDELTREIARRGLIISERPPGTKPTARDFPRRNRLISGLSRGVIVVEAAARSGTLITTRFALEQGREVFAVPGSPLDPRCAGANRLIRDGATLIENADDVIAALSRQTRLIEESSPDYIDGPKPDLPNAQMSAAVMNEVKTLLSFTPVHLDEFLREIDAPPGLILDSLLTLVLAGEAAEADGGKFILGENQG